jgi:photosystem II stability/assembly factor-like uncharacterized protein
MVNGAASLLPASANNPVTGAIEAVVAHPTNPNILYAAAVNGGIWTTSNATATSPTWTPLTDSLPSLSMGAIALDRSNPQTIVAGTGRWSSFFGDGGSQGQLFVSRNAGRTWAVLTDPLFAGQKVSGVGIRGTTILAAFIDSVGLVRTTDGGATWKQVSQTLGSGFPAGAVDALIESVENGNQGVNRFFATLSGVGVFRTDDAGATWVNVSQNDPGPGGLDQTIRTSSIGAKGGTSHDGRLFIGILSPDGTLNFVAFTTDQGNHWTHMDSPGVTADGQPVFHFYVGADPINSSFVYVAGISFWLRGNTLAPSGTQWSPLANEGTPHATRPHIDVRGVTFDANFDLVEVGDGGIFRRVRPRETTGDYFSLAGNLQSAEIHDIAFDANSSVILAGTQDNGPLFQLAPNQLPWTAFLAGDGGDVAVDVQSNPGFSIRYMSKQSLVAFSRMTFDAHNVQVSQVFPSLSVVGGGDALQAPFVTPVVLNKVNPRRLVIAGANAVYESFDQAEHITSLVQGGGSSELAYGHPANPDVLYAAHGIVLSRLTANGALAPTPTPFPTLDSHDLVIDPGDFHTLYVNGNSSVFVTRDAGSTWVDITGNLRSFTPGRVRSIEFVPGASRKLLVVGTDVGVFASNTNALGTWQQVGMNLPHTPVYDTEFNAQKNRLVVGLLGRGAWSVSGLGT